MAETPQKVSTEVSTTIYDSVEINALFGEILAKVKSEREAMMKREKPRIHAKYGEVIDDDIRKIVEVEKEIEQCKDCDGETCPHSNFGQRLLPIIEVREHRFGVGDKKLCADIRYTPC